MVKKLAAHIITWQVNKGFLTKENRNLYTYAYELLIGQVINLVIACLLAVIFHSYVTVFVYLASYILLRSFAGGYHANTNETCTVVSTFILCGVCIAARCILPGQILLVNAAGTLVSGFAVFTLAPVQDHNKPLNQAERKRYRIFSRWIWLAETVLWVGCYRLGAKEASLAIALGHITLALLLGMGTVKNRSMRF